MILNNYYVYLGRFRKGWKRVIKFLKRLMGVNVQPATSTTEPKSEEMVKEQLISSPPPQVERPEIAMPQTAKTSAPKDEIEDDTHMAPSPIITDPTKREYDKGFRLEDDERHVVRINQLQPKGFPKKIAEFNTVA
mgnify:CR=1 FL=1